MLLFSIIPLIICVISLEGRFDDLQIKNIRSTAAQLVAQQKASLDNYSSSIEAVNKKLADSSLIIEIVQESNNKEKVLDNQMSLLMSNMEYLQQSDNTLLNVIIIDKNDTIISSYKAIDPIIEQMLIKDKNIEFRNGFSEFFSISDDSNSFPYFAYSIDIIDINKQVVGKLITLYDTSFIQDTIRLSESFVSSTTSLIDFNGNVLEFPFVNLSKYQSSYRYSDASKSIKEVIDLKDDGVFCEYKIEKDNRIGFIKHTRVLNSAIMLSFDKNDALHQLSGNSFFTFFLSLSLIIVLIILIFIFVHRFTKPIEQILLTIKKKKHGDKFVRFSIGSNNEFFDIGNSFNSLVDDLTESEQRYRTVIEMNDNIIFEYNLNKRTVKFSNNYNKKFSYRPKSENYVDSFLVHCKVHPEDRARYNKALRNAFEKRTKYQDEFRFQSIYGDYIWYHVRAVLLFDNNELPYKVVGVMIDIDNAKKSEKKLLMRAEYDGLTKLFNRETFINQLANEYQLARLRNLVNAILFIDLDDFKFFNDEYGHACGDEVLKFVASTIKDRIGDNGFAGRYGGDEFVICYHSGDNEEDVKEICRHIIKTLESGFISFSARKVVSVTCSIGISFFSESGNNLETIIDEADEAMYKIKKHGKSDFAIYHKK